MQEMETQTSPPTPTFSLEPAPAQEVEGVQQLPHDGPELLLRQVQRGGVVQISPEVRRSEQMAGMTSYQLTPPGHSRGS